MFEDKSGFMVQDVFFSDMEILVSKNGEWSTVRLCAGANKKIFFKKLVQEDWGV